MIKGTISPKITLNIKNGREKIVAFPETPLKTLFTCKSWALMINLRNELRDSSLGAPVLFELKTI